MSPPCLSWKMQVTSAMTLREMALSKGIRCLKVKLWGPSLANGPSILEPSKRIGFSAHYVWSTGWVGHAFLTLQVSSMWENCFRLVTSIYVYLKDNMIVDEKTLYVVTIVIIVNVVYLCLYVCCYIQFTYYTSYIHWVYIYIYICVWPG